MMTPRRFGFWIVPLLFAGLAWVIASAPSRSADDSPPKTKPPSIEDELRELKRRADIADRKFAEQLKKNEALEASLEAAEGKLKHAATARDEIVRQAALDRVPVGAMIPYFGAGDTPPKGYVFADGKTMWPDANWVPKYLRQKVPVPDMRACLIGGAGAEQEVGHMYDKGELKVEGKSFEVSINNAEKEAKLTNAHALLGEFDTGLFDAKVIMGTSWGPDLDKAPLKVVRGRALTINDHFWAKVKRQTPPKYNEAESAKVGGTQTLKLNTRDSLPLHLMCRWIIRVE